MANIQQKRATKPKAAQPAAVTAYLVAYNVFSALGWAYILLLTVAHLTGQDVSSINPTSSSTETQDTARTVIQRILSLVYTYLPFLRPPPANVQEHVERVLPPLAQPLWARAKSTFSFVGVPTKLVQTGAVLEVLHVLFGLVRSSLPTTVMQVASRLILVWGIADRFPAAQTSPLYASMVLAWSLTEVIRYAFYASNLVGAEPRILVWLRYTTFFLLYPIGAGSEAFVMFSTLPNTSPLPQGGVLPWTTEEYLRAAMFVIWWPGLYVMYTFMMGQRRKVLGGGRQKVKTQ